MKCMVVVFFRIFESGGEGNVYGISWCVGSSVGECFLFFYFYFLFYFLAKMGELVSV